MASDVFSNGRWTAHPVDLCLSAKAPSPSQHQNIFADLANSIVELWRANLAGFTSLSQIDEFKSKTLYARLWRESGGPLDTKQVEDLQAAAEQRSAQLAETRYKCHSPWEFRQSQLAGLLSPKKQLVSSPIRRRSWRKGKCELGFWRNISKDDGKLIIQAAQRYEESARSVGERIGPLGPIGLEVLKLLVNLAIAGNGRVEPQLTWIMSKVRRSKCAVVAALTRLRRHGFIDWRRRYVPTRSEGPGPQVKQTSNAYRIIVETAKLILFGCTRPSPLSHDVEPASDEHEGWTSTWSAAGNQSDQRESAEQAENSPILYSKNDDENGLPDKHPKDGASDLVRRFVRHRSLSG